MLMIAGRSQDFSSSEGKETLGSTLLLQYPGPRFFVFQSGTISVNIMEGCKINAKLCEAIKRYFQAKQREIYY